MWRPLALVAAYVAAAACESVTPIQKVLEVMQDMKSRVTKEKKEEAIRFASFKQFCDDTTTNKKASVARAGRQIAKLEAEIARASADVIALGKEVAELQGTAARRQADQNAARDIRTKEGSDYSATRGQYEEAIRGCQEAELTLRNLHGKVPQSVQSLLLSLQSHPSMTRAGISTLTSFVDANAVGATPSQLTVAAPEAYAYEGQSDGVLKMIVELRDRFASELRELDKTETSAKHAHNLLSQRLQQEVQLATSTAQERAHRQKVRQGDAANAAGQKTDAEALKASEESYIDDLSTLSQQKSGDFESRQQLRAEEIEALSKAIDLISSQSLLQTAARYSLPSRTALVQMQRVGNSPHPNENLQRAASLLRQRAASLHSPALALLAQQAGQNPFGKVTAMIKDLIVRLREEANAEADHNAWCSAELATNEKTRTHSATAVEELTTESEKLTAEISRLAQEISDLTAEIASIDSAIMKATAERQTESQQNAATIKDAQESRNVVAQALTLLREFYAKAQGATALVQQTPMQDAPSVFDTPYQGMQGESIGVTGLLEVIESDFARLEATTDSEEQAAQTAHQNFLDNVKQNKAVASAAIEKHESNRKVAEQSLAATQRSLEGSQVQLDAANAYYDKLKPDCVDAGVDYSERVRRREEELESLRDAYKIISGEDVPSLRSMKAEQVGTGGPLVD
jgi:hypothetical protein